jgi:hypothetical protein
MVCGFSASLVEKMWTCKWAPICVCGQLFPKEKLQITPGMHVTDMVDIFYQHVVFKIEFSM